MPTTCIYKTVTLQPNEPFNLPPGAELIAASDINNLKSTCPIPTNLEDVECFVSIIPIAANDGADSQFWEGDTNRTFLIGYVLNGVYTAFTTEYSTSAGGRIENDTGFKAEILNIPGISYVAFNYAIDIDRGSLNYILATTVSSVANNLELVIKTSIPPGDIADPTEGKGYFKFVTRASVSTYQDLPACNIITAPLP